jgi:hypothetical protein
MEPSVKKAIDIKMLLSFEEQKLIEKVVKLLEPFKRATIMLSSKSEPTLPAVMPLLKKMEGLLIETETDTTVIKKSEGRGPVPSTFLTYLTLNSNVLQRLGSVYGPEILEEANVSVGRKVVAYFHRSLLATGILKEKQKRLLPPEFQGHKLIQDVVTRWNSTLMGNIFGRMVSVHFFSF